MKLWLYNWAATSSHFIRTGQKCISLLQKKLSFSRWKAIWSAKLSKLFLNNPKIWRLPKKRLKDTIQPRVWQWEWLCFCIQLNSALCTQKINSSSGWTAPNPKLILQGRTGVINEGGFDLFPAISGIKGWITHRALLCCILQLGMHSLGIPWEPRELSTSALQSLCFGISPVFLLSPNTAAPAEIPVGNCCQECPALLPSVPACLSLCCSFSSRIFLPLPRWHFPLPVHQMPSDLEIPARPAVHIHQNTSPTLTESSFHLKTFPRVCLIPDVFSIGAGRYFQEQTKTLLAELLTARLKTGRGGGKCFHNSKGIESFIFPPSVNKKQCWSYQQFLGCVCWDQ